MLHGAVAGLIVGGALLFHHRGVNWGENASNAGAIQADDGLVDPSASNAANTGHGRSYVGGAEPCSGDGEREDRSRTYPPIRSRFRKKPKPPKVADKPTPAPPKHVQPVTPPPTKAVTGETAGIRIAQSTLELKNGTSSVSVQDRSFGERYAYYVNIVNSKVSQNWYKSEADPLASMDKSTTILFDIDREGVPSNARVETRSGSPSLDLSALRAVQRVDGFGPLPQGNRITVEFTFHFRPQ